MREGVCYRDAHDDAPRWSHGARLTGSADVDPSRSGINSPPSPPRYKYTHAYLHLYSSITSRGLDRL